MRKGNKERWADGEGRREETEGRSGEGLEEEM